MEDLFVSALPYVSVYKLHDCQQCCLMVRQLLAGRLPLKHSPVLQRSCLKGFQSSPLAEGFWGLSPCTVKVFSSWPLTLGEGSCCIVLLEWAGEPGPASSADLWSRAPMVGSYTQHVGVVRCCPPQTTSYPGLLQLPRVDYSNQVSHLHSVICLSFVG